MKKFKYNKVWFTSDLHFNHNNIITKFQFRPFKDVTDMQEQLILKWNSVVEIDDFIFILGDFSMHLTKEENKKILQKLNGIKYFILGNHDNLRQTPKECFENIKDIMDIKVEEKKGKVTQISLCHYPMLSWKGSHHGSWQLYGHLHGEYSNKELSNDSFNLKGALRTKQQLDVGTDVHDFFPISYSEVKELLKKG